MTDASGRPPLAARAHVPSLDSARNAAPPPQRSEKYGLAAEDEGVHPPEWSADGARYVRKYLYDGVYTGPRREDEVPWDEFVLRQRGWSDRSGRWRNELEILNEQTGILHTTDLAHLARESGGRQRKAGHDARDREETPDSEDDDHQQPPHGAAAGFNILSDSESSDDGGTGDVNNEYDTLVTPAFTDATRTMVGSDAFGSSSQKQQQEEGTYANGSSGDESESEAEDENKGGKKKLEIYFDENTQRIEFGGSAVAQQQQQAKARSDSPGQPRTSRKVTDGTENISDYIAVLHRKGISKESELDMELQRQREQDEREGEEARRQKEVAAPSTYEHGQNSSSSSSSSSSDDDDGDLAQNNALDESVPPPAAVEMIAPQFGVFDQNASSDSSSDDDDEDGAGDMLNHTSTAVFHMQQQQQSEANGHSTTEDEAVGGRPPNESEDDEGATGGPLHMQEFYTELESASAALPDKTVFEPSRHRVQAMTPISERSHEHTKTSSRDGRFSMGSQLGTLPEALFGATEHGELGVGHAPEPYEDPTVPLQPHLYGEQQQQQYWDGPRIGSNIVWLEEEYIAAVLRQLPEVMFDWDGYRPLLKEQKLQMVEALSDMVAETEEEEDEPCLVSIGTDTFDIRRKVGEGGYATVYLAVEADDDDLGSRAEDDTQALARENARMALKVQQPAAPWECYVMRLLHAQLPAYRARSFAHVERFYNFADCSALLMPYKPQGTLLDCVNLYTESGSFLPELLAAFFSVEMLKALEDLYDCGVVHTDLKPNNFLLRLEESSGWAGNYSGREAADNGWGAKGLYLIDFGRALHVAGLPSGRNTTVTADWVADETEHPCVFDSSGNVPAHALDAFGAAGCIHVLLFGAYISVAEHAEGPDPVTLLPRYRLTRPLRRYWRTEEWRAVFEALLNPPRDPRKYRRTLTQLREQLERWLETEDGLKGLVRRLEIMLLEKGLS